MLPRNFLATNLGVYYYSRVFTGPLPSSECLLVLHALKREGVYQTGAQQCVSRLHYLIIDHEQASTLIKLRFFTLSIVLLLSKSPFWFCLKTRRFGDWILSAFSGKIYSVIPNQ
jgi:hypothetical protein